MSPVESEAGAVRQSLAALATRLARQGLAPGPAIPVHGLEGSARAAFVAALHRAGPRPILVVTTDLRRAEDLVRDIGFFAGEASSGDALARRIHLLPSWDTPPFSAMSPSAASAAVRIEGLYHLAQSESPILVAPVEALLQRAMAPSALAGAVRYYVEGDTLDLDQLTGGLIDWGYRRRTLVEDRGDLAVRGGLIDVFVTGCVDPVRVELVGDVIESIRTFDRGTQRRLSNCEDVLILPAAEVPLGARRDRARLEALENRASDLEMLRQERLDLLEAVREGLPVPGIEFLAPFFVEMVPLLDYLPASTLVVLDGENEIRDAASAAWRNVEQHAEAAWEERRLHPEPAELYQPPNQVLAMLDQRPRIVLDWTDAVSDDALCADARSAFGLDAGRLLRDAGSVGQLGERIRAWTAADRRVALVVGTASQADRLRHILEAQSVEVAMAGEALPQALEARAGACAFVLLGELGESVDLPGDRLVCVAETNLFGEHRHQRRRQAAALSLDEVMRNLEQLRPNDFVVHADHGIGRYHGLRHLTVSAGEGDFLQLEYAGGDRLYVPVDRVNTVQKYVGGDGASPVLDKLGSPTWDRVKLKTKESIFAMAAELLALYATRSRSQGHAFSTDDPWYQEFEARFPFDETPDQDRAIREVLEDLGGSKPMDRLVCGDVGYGKTEVAMRAAFIVAMEGRQVAVVVPTTVLAQQHFESFRRRFEGYPVQVEMVSGFRTRGENTTVIGGLGAGKVDVVIGTHRLFSSDVEFANLGLLIIDEEHRFGVKQKEKIKQLRKTVDVLALSATPIPRTLELSLSGIRDLSVIETPPVDRQAIQTWVTRPDDHAIRDAMLRELQRSGQIFFVHNRVETIERRAMQLRAIVPEARIEVAHGQMREHALEKVMMRFMRHEFDVLLCTAIIESGLDIPNANTILIDRADTFGLAQLYQLRGRVGRSPARAYAYLLVPGERQMSRDAQLRLKVLQELDELGGGFRIAAQDLEIRGAGNLLGKDQSGHVTAVGFEMYTRMMEDAVHELRGEEIDEDVEPEVHLGVTAFLPDSYVDDVDQRLVLYRRLAAMRAPEDRDALAAELRDRFGPLPEMVEILLDVMELRRRLKRLKIREIRRRAGRLSIRLHPASPVPTEAVVAMVARGEAGASLTPDGVLSMPLAPGEERAAVRAAWAVLERIAALIPVAPAA